MKTHANGVYRFALKHLRNEMSADDIVQECFMKVWNNRDNIAGEKVKSYIFTTAYTCIMDWIKREKRHGDVEMVKHENASPEAHAFDLKSVLDEALARLPEIQKSVILLRDYEGYNYQEIGEITGLSEAQVKVYIFRGRQQLKNYIKHQDLVA